MPQVLSEMEEIIRYKDQSPLEQQRVRKMWLQRLKGAQQDPAVWQPLLKVCGCWGVAGVWAYRPKAWSVVLSVWAKTLSGHWSCISRAAESDGTAQIRSLVLSPADDLDMALEYVTLCRHSGSSLALERAHSYLISLLGG